LKSDLNESRAEFSPTGGRYTTSRGGVAKLAYNAAQRALSLEITAWHFTEAGKMNLCRHDFAAARW
jgi:hypothetical protein